MQTDKLTITKDRGQIKAALDKVELIAQYAGMNRRESANMCLLAEELILSVQNILDQYEGELWVDTNKERFEIHIKADVYADSEDKEKLLAISKTGENTKPKGFLGRISLALDNIFSANGDAGTIYGMDMIGCDPGFSVANPSAYYFSYARYKDEMAAAPAKLQDELEGIEKAIIESIADDITVTVRSNSVHIVAIKLMNE